MSVSQSQEHKMTVKRRPMAFNQLSAATYSAAHVEELLENNDIAPYLVGRFQSCGSVVVVGNVPQEQSIVRELSSQISCPNSRCSDCMLTQHEYHISKKAASITADQWINGSMLEERFGFTASSLAYEGNTSASA